MKYHKDIAEDELYNEITYYEETTKNINLKYVTMDYEEFYNNDTIIIESGTGTGKTTCVSNLFKHYKNETGSTILSIVNLVSLAEQQKQTFKKNGISMTMYNDEKVNPAIIISHDSCICINSLWRLSSCNFSNTVVYMDEIYSICMSLTHNDTIHKQRHVFNTLYRMIKECKKLVVSDAHIHNNVMKLIETRLFMDDKEYIHIYNAYKKFNGVPSVRYNDENEFYNTIKDKVLNGDSFSFGCDSKSIIEKWYNKLYDMASPDIQKNMFLYMSEIDNEIQQDWNNKIIFYSPKITTGVDITCINSSTQFMYITGKSVSSINLLQMATRTRNMNQLNYYSTARSNNSLYEDLQDCETKIASSFTANKLGYSFEDIEDFLDNKDQFNVVERLYMDLYVRNCYTLDVHNTNVLYFFEQELLSCGFVSLKSVGAKGVIDKELQNQFSEQIQQNKDTKFDILLESLVEDDEDNKLCGVKIMRDRCNILNLSTPEHIKEYREVIEDQQILDHFFNYNGLKKPYDYCEYKINEKINMKMITGIEKDRWFKIKYIHMLAKLCGIEDKLLAVEEMQMPELNKENMKLITSIKKLYRKRDSIEITEYDIDTIKQLYKFMIDNLVKKLKLLSSVKNKSRDENRDKTIIRLNEKAINKYDKLIELMNNYKPYEYTEIMDYEDQYE